MALRLPSRGENDARESRLIHPYSGDRLQKSTSRMLVLSVDLSGLSPGDVAAKKRRQAADEYQAGGGLTVSFVVDLSVS
jgi:hypothetical protein